MITSDIAVDLNQDLRGTVRVWMEPNGTDVTIRFYTFDEKAQTWVEGKPELYQNALRRALIARLRGDRGEFSARSTNLNLWRLIDRETGCHLIQLAPKQGYGSLRVRVPLPQASEWSPVFEELRHGAWAAGHPNLQQAALEEALANTILRQHWEHEPRAAEHP